MSIKTVEKKKKKYRYYGKEKLTSDVLANKSLRSSDPKKIHVDLYLRAKKVKIWERGGKIAYAEKKGMSFATEKEFDELFKSY